MYTGGISDMPSSPPRLPRVAHLLRFDAGLTSPGGKKFCVGWPTTSLRSPRGNAGVSSVTCLVFDLDRVPPDPNRLQRVCWIGHRTCSHGPNKPRWRVVIPASLAARADRPHLVGAEEPDR